MPKSLVIVESPTKARTIARFLGKDFVVESSVGHVRDLPDSAKEIPARLKKEPWARLGIDVSHGFKPLYVVPSEKKKQLDKLKGLLADADTLYLATDEDREGESISWHLLEVLKPRIPARRLVFHEITAEAIQQALQQPRDVDGRLVTAQETRRILDRLYGYEVSPLLWRTIAPALSAGRVQSVAVRMVVQRERQRMAFRQASYWDLQGRFRGDGEPFKAQLVSLGEQRVAAGRDFDDRTGELKSARRNLLHLDAEGARALQQRLEAAEWRVIKVERKPYTSQPAPPFTTSTMQQEASRKLNLASRQAMRVAQSLYERGFITYMRTDSTTLSGQAVRSARSQIRSLYGEDHLPDKPREYRARVKNAQEAHEAIRPAGDIFRLPESLRSELNPEELRLYELIWKRTVASQMADARGHRLTLQVQGDDAVFQATGRTIEFPGYLRAYVEGSDDPQAVLGDQETLLPPLKEGDPVTAEALEPQEHRTQPPARYTEASLIKELEKEGVGRPSTYAAIIDTILRREYVSRRGQALVPSFTAFAVVRLLEQYFGHLVDIGFTARMEDALDRISRGEQERQPYLEEFYYGNGVRGLSELVRASIDPRQACTIPLAKDSRDRQINIRVGKYGPFLERNGDRASIPVDQVPDELTAERAETLLERGSHPEVLGKDPESGRNIYVKTGRYGPYVQLGEAGGTGERPKMKSLLPGQSPETLTYDEALQLLSLPRSLGEDPDTGEEITVDLGRYGPYARRGRDTRSLPTPQALFSMSLEEVRELFRKAKGRPGQAMVVRELGPHPDSGETVRLMTGRYGPYVTDGQVNASLPRGADPEKVELEEAVRLLREKAARGPTTRKGGRRNTAAASQQRSGTATSRTGGAKGRKTASGNRQSRSGEARKSGKRRAG